MAIQFLAPPKSQALRKCGMKLIVDSDNGNSVLLRVEGRVSQRDVEASDPIVDTVGEDVYSRRLVMDLSEVASLDSSGVNWLLVAQKRMHEQGGKLVLHSLSPIANNVLKVLNLHTVFQIADSEAAALRTLGGDAR
jgi:anti-anti-sigma factor